MEIFTFSAKGRRENNEDYVLSRQLLSGYSIHLLADGMGGHEHGEIASMLACEAIAGYLGPNLANSDIVSTLQQSVINANSMMLSNSQELGAKMGTTIAGALIQGNKANIFWLGDVRIYHFRRNELLFQSEDHSIISELKKQGTVSPKEMERYGNIVTQSLSGHEIENNIPITTLNIIPGDLILLCSDGLWRNLDIVSFKNLTKTEITNQLKAHEKDVEDNYSIVRIDV